jgi:hypothetical protein
MSKKNDFEDDKSEIVVPFWYEDPNILFDTKFITEFFPLTSMTFNQKLNALSRTIIFCTIVLFLFTRSLGLLFGSLISLVSIYIHFYLSSQEGFETDEDILQNPALDYLQNNNIEVPKNVFQEPSPKNPFSNALISDNVYKKPAPPIINQNVKNSILEQAIQLVNESNPGQPDISNKLFSNTGDMLGFEQSLRQFHTTASTTIPNDQGAFAEFCYGSMNSCKSGNLFNCAKQLSNEPNI